MGLRDRQRDNAQLRMNGIEPEPGFGASVKRVARYLKRSRIKPVRIWNPDRYLHSAARRRKLALAA